MKIKIFSQGYKMKNGKVSWYVSANNMNDKTDRAKMYLYFVDAEPLFMPNKDGYDMKDIDVIEGKFTSYQNKIGMTIFKYELLSEIEVSPKNMMNDNGERYEFTALNDGETDMFGGKIEDVPIDTSDLPFY